MDPNIERVYRISTELAGGQDLAEKLKEVEKILAERREYESVHLRKADPSLSDETIAKMVKGKCAFEISVIKRIKKIIKDGRAGY